jgi:ferric iron reductase protein FhuF
MIIVSSTQKFVSCSKRLIWNEFDHCIQWLITEAHQTNLNSQTNTRSPSCSQKVKQRFRSNKLRHIS